MYGRQHGWTGHAVKCVAYLLIFRSYNVLLLSFRHKTSSLGWLSSGMVKQRLARSPMKMEGQFKNLKRKRKSKIKTFIINFHKILVFPNNWCVKHNLINHYVIKVK